MSETPQPVTAGDILARYRVSPDPIRFNLPNEEPCSFKALPNAKARRRMTEDVQRFVDNLPTLETVGHKDHFIARFAEMEDGDRSLCAEIHLRSIEPYFDAEAAFELFNAPTVLEHIKYQLDKGDKELARLFIDRTVEEAGKASTTHGNEGASTPAEPPSPDANPTT